LLLYIILGADGPHKECQCVPCDSSSSSNATSGESILDQRSSSDSSVVPMRVNHRCDWGCICQTCKKSIHSGRHGATITVCGHNICAGGPHPPTCTCPTFAFCPTPGTHKKHPQCTATDVLHPACAPHVKCLNLPAGCGKCDFNSLPAKCATAAACGNGHNRECRCDCYSCNGNCSPPNYTPRYFPRTRWGKIEYDGHMKQWHGP
jgi:hypothetical protein